MKVRVFNNLNIGVKLPLMTVLIGILSIGIAEVIASANARATVMVSGYDRLLAVAESRATEVQRELNAIRADLRGQSSNPVLLEAARAFVTGWDRHGDTAARDLRRLYITGNPFPPERRYRLTQADDASAYSRAHRRYHPFFQAKMQGQRYTDIFLIAPNGTVVYSAAKTEVFGTHLDQAPLRNAGLPLAFRRARNGTGFSTDFMTDFIEDPMADGARSAIFALPIRSPAGVTEAVLAVRVSIDRVDEIMVRSAGLGRSGEAFLSDGGTRISGLRGAAPALTGTVPENPVSIDNLGEGREMLVHQSADGVDVISAHVPLMFMGRRLGVYVQQAEPEIMAPAKIMRQQMIEDGAVALSVITVLGLMIARSMSVPLARVDQAMRRVALRDYQAEIPGRDRKDEIGKIARRLDAFRASLLEAEARAREVAFKGAAFEQSGAALMLVDRHLTILYVNARMTAFLNAHRIAIDRYVTDFKPDLAVGRPLDMLFPGALRMRDRLQDVSHVTDDIRLGSAHLRIEGAMIRDEADEPVGLLLEWRDVTDLQRQDLVRRVAEAHTPLAAFSPDGRLIEMNEQFSVFAGTARAALGAHWDSILSAGSISADLDVAVAYPDWAGVSAGVRADCPFWVAPLSAGAGVAEPAILSPLRDFEGRLQRMVLVLLPRTAVGEPREGAAPPARLSHGGVGR